ncbi:Cytosolic Fe-S cluster assembly factor NAR1 [Golovinomyces cichoracearum]|uniref:Cytosolic Fe-S cluster assembly factor NAR1 n=1 Tax=Golovinomyces cichoracearum TaxID=62708 RepID=A0A420ISA7_9PEZI|nr:Cytosolic Fe-S cluster assembly factor NAR1 [Golovinomyces cichoracearum]
MSAILSTDDLNDFISPGVACIKPVETLLANTSTNVDGLEISFNNEETFSGLASSQQQQAPVQISLTDCLACSGCVTSAEAVLISLQSHAEVLAELDAAPAIRVLPDGTLTNLEQGGKIFIASVSPQSRASLAAAYGVTQREAGFMIEQLLSGPKGIISRAVYRNSFHWVVDTNVARNICLFLGAEEVMISLPNRENTQDYEDRQEQLVKKPILTSSCPGWICYAEKTHPYVLPHLSRLKSPQAMTGTLLKTTLCKKFGISPDRIWHVAIMPCFDKKLEASRAELTDISWGGDVSKGIRDVDSVLTTKELLMLAETRRIDFAKLPRSPVSMTQFPDPKLNSFLFSNNRQLLSNKSYEFGSSGGNLYYILNTFVSQNRGSTIQTTRGRNSDVQEYSVRSQDGEILFRAARYYGFRNIQNVVRRLKPAKLSRIPGGKLNKGSKKASGNQPGPEYSYIEVMACPGGCTNGGGQIRVDDPTVSSYMSEVGSGSLSKKLWLSRVDEAYFSGDDDPSVVQTKTDLENGASYIKDILAYWSGTTGIDIATLAFTTYRKVESDVGKNIDHNQKVIEIAGKIGGGW